MPKKYETIGKANAAAISLSASVGAILGTEWEAGPGTWGEGPYSVIAWELEDDEGYSVRLIQIGTRVLLHIDTEPTHCAANLQKCLTIIGYASFHGHEWISGNWPGIEALLTQPKKAPGHADDTE